MNSTIIPIILFICTLFSCNEPITNTVTKEPNNKPIETLSTEINHCFWDSIMKNNGLANIIEIDSSLMIDLKYSTEDNFMKKDIYGCLNNCYLQPDVAEKLKSPTTKVIALFVRATYPKMKFVRFVQSFVTIKMEMKQRKSFGEIIVMLTILYIFL